MKNTILLILCLLTANQLYCIDFQSDFDRYFKGNDTINQLKTLEAWEKANPQDAELYTCFFNYYISKAKDEVLSLTTVEPEGEALEIKDSTGKVAGFLGSQIGYDRIEFNKGIVKIDEGIKRYPNRLDMRFGKIYILGEIKDWEHFTQEIIEAVRQSKVNDNQWTWTGNELKKNGKDMFLSSLQDYQLQLYNTEVDSLLVNMRNIAMEILKFYPEHVESLSNLSVTYLLTKEYDQAIEVLLRAEQISPSDNIVLLNIAQGYKLKGDKQNAVEYYKKVLKIGDKESKDYAKQQISELGKIK